MAYGLNTPVVALLGGGESLGERAPFGGGSHGGNALDGDIGLRSFLFSSWLLASHEETLAVPQALRGNILPCPRCKVTEPRDSAVQCLKPGAEANFSFFKLLSLGGLSEQQKLTQTSSECTRMALRFPFLLSSPLFPLWKQPVASTQP